MDVGGVCSQPCFVQDVCGRAGGVGVGRGVQAALLRADGWVGGCGRAGRRGVGGGLGFGGRCWRAARWLLCGHVAVAPRGLRPSGSRPASDAWSTDPFHNLCPNTCTHTCIKAPQKELSRSCSPCILPLPAGPLGRRQGLWVWPGAGALWHGGLHVRQAGHHLRLRCQVGLVPRARPLPPPLSSQSPSNRCCCAAGAPRAPPAAVQHGRQHRRKHRGSGVRDLPLLFEPLSG